MANSNNERPVFDADLTHCAYHPDRPAMGWRDVTDENGALSGTVGVCPDCAVAMGAIDGPLGGAVRLLSPGEPCRCGPGFCASSQGLGYFGRCAGSRAESAPDCPRCDAPHQSTAGCWLCREGEEGYQRVNSRAWAKLARYGLSGDSASTIQALEGLSFDAAVDELVRRQKVPHD